MDDSGLTNLEVWGYQPRETTPWINASSDLCMVLLSPHVRCFSFPSKIYTLMACGKPVLLYGDPEADVARFVRDTGIGWVVRTGTSMVLWRRCTPLPEWGRTGGVRQSRDYRSARAIYRASGSSTVP